MSSSAYALALKNLAGAFKTKNPSSNVVGGPESSAHHEDVVEFAAPLSSPILVDETFEDITDISDAPEGLAPKKRNHNIVKPPKVRGPVIEKVVCDEEGKDLEGVLVHIGNFTLEKFSSTLSEIPTHEDWVEMEGAGLNSVLKRVAGLGIR